MWKTFNQEQEYEDIRIWKKKFQEVVPEMLKNLSAWKSPFFANCFELLATIPRLLEISTHVVIKCDLFCEGILSDMTSFLLLIERTMYNQNINHDY